MTKKQRDNVSAIVDEIERLSTALAPDVAHDPEDREALDIIKRIERRIRRKRRQVVSRVGN
jgi:hypothetical protein